MRVLTKGGEQKAVCSTRGGATFQQLHSAGGESKRLTYFGKRLISLETTHYEPASCECSTPPEHSYILCPSLQFRLHCQRPRAAFQQLHTCRDGWQPGKISWLSLKGLSECLPWPA